MVVHSRSRYDRATKGPCSLHLPKRPEVSLLHTRSEWLGMVECQTLAGTTITQGPLHQGHEITRFGNRTVQPSDCIALFMGLPCRNLWRRHLLSTTGAAEPNTIHEQRSQTFDTSMSLYSPRTIFSLARGTVKTIPLVDCIAGATPSRS